jgi:NodT family efflux transporter outer membrane factor (OMF) lipoprotein
MQVGLLALMPYLTGCTSPSEFVHNGFKLGPNYQRPPAPLAPQWIDVTNPKVNTSAADLSAWWGVFGDPVLNDLVRTAYAQNVNLRVAGTRVLAARAQRGIAVGELFPQVQQANGTAQRIGTSRNDANKFLHPHFNNWAVGLNASWEIDFWGKVRRNIETADALVDASIDDYDNVMVTLIGDLATAYVQYRVTQQQIVYYRENIVVQGASLQIATDRFKAGQANELPVEQGKSLLEQLEATVPLLEIQLRQANNQICVLLGIPPEELAAKLGAAPIPRAPAQVVVGMPADLIRRRPDVRSLERQIVAQNAQIGVAEADMYPAFFINGSIGYQAKSLSQLFASGSLIGALGPAFQWNILNYGRILNNVLLQDAKTQELVGNYQQQVLSAAQEVDNGIVSFWRSQDDAAHRAASVRAAARAVELSNAQFKAGAIDYTNVFVAEQQLVQQQDAFAIAQGNIALGLIQVYRALGGGWELRLAEDAANAACAPAVSLPAQAAMSPPSGDFASAWRPRQRGGVADEE